MADIHVTVYKCCHGEYFTAGGLGPALEGSCVACTGDNSFFYVLFLCVYLYGTYIRTCTCARSKCSEDHFIAHA